MGWLGENYKAQERRSWPPLSQRQEFGPLGQTELEVS